MNKEKVYVTNMTNGVVVVDIPDLRFRREWPKKGARFAIDKEILEEAIYDPAFDNLIKEGMLYIEDLETKKELGLEPEDATAPVNILILTDKERDYYLRVCGYDKFVEKVDSLPAAQVLELVEYAIQNQCLDSRKCEYLYEKTGRDVFQTVALLKQSAAVDKREE